MFFRVGVAEASVFGDEGSRLRDGFTLRGFSIGPRRTLVSTHSLMTEEDQE